MLSQRFLHAKANDVYLGPGLYRSVRHLLRHLLLLGGSGLGKTYTSLLLATQIVDLRAAALFFVDPIGLFSHGIKEHLYRRRRFEHLALFDPTHVARFGYAAGIDCFRNALETTTQAAYAIAAMRTAAKDDPQDPMPTFMRWGRNSFIADCELGLTMADTEKVINPVDDAYRKVVVATLADTYGDVVSDFQQLLNNQGNDRFFNDNLLSLLNRVRSNFGNRLLRPMYSTRDHALDFQGWMQPGNVVGMTIPAGLFCDAEMQRMAGVSFIEAVLRAAISRPQPAPPVILFIDEAHRFASPLLQELLDSARNFNCHVWFAHQHLEQWRDPVLRQSVLANTYGKIAFRGVQDDALTLAAELEAPWVNPYREKIRLYSPTQFSHLKMMDVHSRAESESESRGKAHARTVGYMHAHARHSGESFGAGSSLIHGDASSYGTSEGLSCFENLDMVSNTGTSHTSGSSDVTVYADQWGETSGESEIEAESVAESHASSRAKARSRSHAVARVPVIAPGRVRWILSSVQFQDVQEQLFEFASALRRLPVQHALAQFGSDRPSFFKVGDYPKPTLRPEHFAYFDHELLRHASWSTKVTVLQEEALARDADIRSRVPKAKEPTHTPPHLLPAPAPQIVVELDVRKPDDATVRVKRTRKSRVTHRRGR